MRAAPDPVALRHPGMVAFFTRIMERQMRGAFRAVRVAKPGVPDLPAGRPLVVYSNHPSWWDPAFGIVLLGRVFPNHQGFAPIEAAMLARYGFFRRMGFFGVEEGRRGAAAFLVASQKILADPRRTLWITAQGRFADVRERPLALRPGVAHLLARMPEAVALPMALEYPFWSEKRPEALCAFGEPLDGREGLGGAAWAERLEGALTATCDRLATLAMARDVTAFDHVLSGRAGVGGVYGLWQRSKALIRGEPYRPDHMAERP